MPSIPYVEVQKWDVNNQGNGRVIVVDSQFRTETSLRHLGQQLRKAYPQDRFSKIEVFDDSALAVQRDRGILGKLPRSVQRQFDKHYLGVYLRNRSTGHESWTFGLNGLTKDPLVEVRY